ncbi:galactosyltransferase-related protein [Streptomyces flavofungini]|uniref:galactosyltransferase-related protein n=1 Tax=Streptomyces flavofungini TaxID=68200 RepID=UPI0034E01107
MPEIPTTENDPTNAPTTENERLARRLTAYAVMAHDPAVPATSADFFELSEPHYRDVDRSLAAFVASSPQASAAYAELTARPAVIEGQRRLYAALVAALGERPEHAVAPLAEAVAEADAHIMIDYHLGDAYTDAYTPEVIPAPDAIPGPAARPAQEAEHRSQPAPVPVPVTGLPQAPQVHIVIPFRDREQGSRTRNLLACLAALARQEGGPGHRVTIVETDDRPRGRALLEPLADRYVFAHKDGLFNKSWAVNVGFVSGQGDLPYVCVLDTDILVDRHFTARGVQRLRSGPFATHLPFTWPLYLDEPSTRRAIEHEEGDVPDAVLRGMLLREPPGGCVWTSAEVFGGVGGFDERFEGWGGEDDDVVARLAAAAPLGRYEDRLLHLNHTRPAMTTGDGQPFNGHIELMTWKSDQGFGDPRKFSPAVTA